MPRIKKECPITKQIEAIKNDLDTMRICIRLMQETDMQIETEVRCMKATINKKKWWHYAFD